MVRALARGPGTGRSACACHRRGSCGHSRERQGPGRRNLNSVKIELHAQEGGRRCPRPESAVTRSSTQSPVTKRAPAAGPDHGYGRAADDVGRRILRVARRRAAFAWCDSTTATPDDRAGRPGPMPSSIGEMMAAFAAGTLKPAYRLEDLADDVIGLLDVLGIDRAHLRRPVPGRRRRSARRAARARARERAHLDRVLHRQPGRSTAAPGDDVGADERPADRPGRASSTGTS